jgi:hypothetical protein
MRLVVFAPVVFALCAPALAPAHSKDANWVIMTPEPGRPQEVPEPWLPPKYKSPRGSRQHVKPLRKHREVDAPRVSTPPRPIVVPQTGVAVPNMQTIAPAGPGGAESFQDRALRCTHQAGAYGAITGDRGTYIGTCVNQ